MPLEVALYKIPNHRRSRLVCDAMAEGIRKIGDKTWTVATTAYSRAHTKPISVFYGMAAPLNRIFAEAREDGRTAIYVDLGYWGRHEGGRYRGFHKVCINGRHPTAYFQKRQHDYSRAAALGVKIEPWRPGGDHILLAGMSGKSSHVDGFEPNQWEREAIEALRAATSRTIIYRPKPSWKAAVPLAGTTFSPKTQPLEEVLQNCHAVVTHHSNVAVDAIVSGIPAFCQEGVGAPLSKHSLAGIDTPFRPGDDERRQWVADIAWTQFSIAEMATGLPWRHIRDEGLV